MKTLSIMLTLIVLTQEILNAQESPDAVKILIQGKSQFENAYRNWNVHEMISAKALFERASSLDPSNTDAMYWNGYAGYRLAIYNLYGKEKNETLAKQFIDDAIEILEKAVETDHHASECYALLGTLTGLKISFNPIAGMWLGPKSNGYYDDAVKTNPNNPRAYFLKGLGKLNTPAIFGGGKEKAISELVKAIELYEKEKSDSASVRPNWGFAECHMFLAETYAASGDTESAITHYRKSLELNPNSHRAKSGLAKIEKTDN